MFASNSTPPRPSRVFLLTFVLALIALVAAMGSFAWMASSWDMGGMMGNDHMGGMMGGGRDSSTDRPREGTETEAVAIKDFAFAPGNLQVPRGATVTWTNRDSAPHSATDSAGAWDTGVLAGGERVRLTFDKSGTFEYYCTLHPNMRARLVVR